MFNIESNFDDVTRIEIISDKKGREFVIHNIKFDQFSLQDDFKTLKIFVNSKEDSQDLNLNN